MKSERMTEMSELLFPAGFLFLGIGLFIWVYQSSRRRGKRQTTAYAWALITVMVLAITWDAIPTWIAFQYYDNKQAGLTIFKTLEQWKAENLGVMEALKPYGEYEKSPISADIELGNKKYRHPLNERFSEDSQIFEKLFLSVYADRYSLIDVKKGEVLAQWVEIGSGNAGGFASGGPGWWKFWLIRKSNEQGYAEYSKYVKAVRHGDG